MIVRDFSAAVMEGTMRSSCTTNGQDALWVMRGLYGGYRSESDAI
jgi:hypothetical protein